MSQSLVPASGGLGPEWCGFVGSPDLASPDVGPRAHPPVVLRQRARGGQKTIGDILLATLPSVAGAAVHLSQRDPPFQSQAIGPTPAVAPLPSSAPPGPRW